MGVQESRRVGMLACVLRVRGGRRQTRRRGNLASSGIWEIMMQSFNGRDRAIKSSTPHGARALSRWCLGGKKKKKEKKETESDRGGRVERPSLKGPSWQVNYSGGMVVVGL